MSRPGEYRTEYNKQIAQFDEGLAAELEVRIGVECDSAFVVVDEGMVSAAGYVTYSGMEGDVHIYDLRTAMRPDADVEAYLCMVELIVEKAQEISSARHQKGLVRSFVNAAAVSTIDTMYAMGYSFGGARLEMELDSGEADEAGFMCCRKDYAITECKGEDEFEEYMSFYGREDLRVSIRNLLSLGARIFAGRFAGHMVSALIVCPGSSVQISNVYTQEPYRRRYFARDLLTYVIGMFRAQCAVFSLDVEAGNDGAISLYQSLGFDIQKVMAQMHYRLEE